MSTKSISSIRMKLDPEVRCQLILYRFDIHSDHVRVWDMGGHPDADSQRRVHVHRFVWRFFNPDDLLTNNDIIHHVNGDPMDNRICNLVKTTREQHRRIHNDMESDDREYQTILRQIARESEVEVIDFMKSVAVA